MPRAADERVRAGLRGGARAGGDGRRAGAVRSQVVLEPHFLHVRRRAERDRERDAARKLVARLLVDDVDRQLRTSRVVATACANASVSATQTARARSDLRIGCSYCRLEIRLDERDPDRRRARRRRCWSRSRCGGPSPSCTGAARSCGSGCPSRRSTCSPLIFACSSACFCSSSSISRASSTRIADSRLRPCERSFWQVTTMPVGMCVMRMAVEFFWTFWPPWPLAR